MSIRVQIHGDVPTRNVWSRSRRGHGQTFPGRCVRKGRGLDCGRGSARGRSEARVHARDYVHACIQRVGLRGRGTPARGCVNAADENVTIVPADHALEATSNDARDCSSTCHII